MNQKAIITEDQSYQANPKIIRGYPIHINKEIIIDIGSNCNIFFDEGFLLLYMAQKNYQQQ